MISFFICDKNYDLVISAHISLVQKPLGYKRVSDVLKSNGYCALFWNKYMNDGSIISDELTEICKE